MNSSSNLFARTIAAVFLPVLLLSASCSSGGEKSKSPAKASTAKAGGGIPADPHSLGNQPIKFDIPKPERWVLPNGLVVLYYFDDELPVMRGKLYFPAGDLYDPNNVPGLQKALGEQLREGSVKGIRPEVLDKQLDDLAASIESGFGDELGGVSFSSLAEDFDTVFSLFARVVKEPAFDAQRMELWKKLASDTVRRRRDDPELMATLAFTHVVYGPDSAWARVPTLESLAKIDRKLLTDAHRMFVRPGGARLALTGAVPKERVKAAVEQHFAGWQEPSLPKPVLPALNYKAKPGIYVLERDFDQATVAIGHQGPERLTPDMFDMHVYNHAFGHSGFGSLLFREIRSRLGLAYSIGGGIFPGPVAGVFQVVLQTRAPETSRAIRSVNDLIQSSTTGLFPEEDFGTSKSSVERSFVFRFANPGSIVDRAATHELLGFPPDFNQKYLENLSKVDREAVREMAKRRVKMEDLVTVVVGKVKPEQIAAEFAGKAQVYRLGFDTAPRIEGPVTP